MSAPPTGVRIGARRTSARLDGWPRARMGLLRELLVALLLGRVLLQLSVLPGAATGTSSAEVGSHLVSMQEGVRQGGQLVAESANTRCICSHKKQHGEQQRGIEHRMANRQAASRWVSASATSPSWLGQHSGMPS